MKHNHPQSNKNLVKLADIVELCRRMISVKLLSDRLTTYVLKLQAKETLQDYLEQSERN
jgi:hypothetical protein